MKYYDVVLNGTPLENPARVLEVKCLVEDEGLRANLRAVLRLGLPHAVEAQPHNSRLALVGSAPSVKDHLEELRSWSGVIWAINGAFCWLHDQGITPQAFVCLDPDKGLEALLPHKPVAIYLLAATCNPRLFEYLSDRKVVLWFPANTAAVEDYPQGVPVISGATTCLTTAPFLAYLLGFRDITIFGGDSSFESSMYCYDKEQYNIPLMGGLRKVRVGEQLFISNRPMLHQVANMIGLTTIFGDMLKFRVGGLMKAALEAPVHEVGLKEMH